MEKKKMNKKALKLGSLSIAVTVIVIAIVIAFNMVVAELPSEWTKIDTTANGLVSFSDATKEYLSKIDDKVEIYLIAEEGSEDALVTQLLNYYKSGFENVSVETVDPVKKPTFVSEYTEDTLSSSSLIVKSDKRHTVVDGSAFYSYEIVGLEGQMFSRAEFDYYSQMYAQYGQQLSANEYFNGESVITSAIDYVTTETLPVMYMLSGHGETELGQYYAQYVDMFNVTAKSLTLLAGDAVEMPEDAAALYINAPQKDISEAEYDALVKYLEGGGNIILTTGSTTYTAEAMPNLARLTEYMGLSALDGVVCEGDIEHYAGQSYYIIPDFSAEGYLADYATSNYMVLALKCHGITATGAENRTVAPVLQTTAEAYMEGSEEKGVKYVAFQSQIANEEAGTTAGTLYWFASDVVFHDELVMTSPYNALMFVEILADTCQMDAPVEVVAKNVSTSATLTVTESDNVIWTFVFTVLVPIVALAGGFVVWFTRRRR